MTDNRRAQFCFSNLSKLRARVIMSPLSCGETIQLANVFSNDILFVMKKKNTICSAKGIKQCDFSLVNIFFYFIFLAKRSIGGFTTCFFFFCS